MATVDISLSSGATIEVSPSSAPSVEVTPANISEVSVQGYAVDSELTQGETGPGVPASGREDQIIVKQSTTNYDTAWEYPDKIIFQIRNDSGVTLNAGDVVYALGEVGSSGVIRVDKCDCSDSSKMPAIGIIREQISDGGTGIIVSQGIFNPNISVSGFSDGQTAYVSTSGTITATKPVYPNLIQNIGTVLETDGTTVQELKVSSIDRTNDVPNLPDGKFFIGSTTNTTTSAYTLPKVVGTNGQILKSDGTDVVFGDASLGVTNLTTTQSSGTQVVVNSDTGTDATIAAATTSVAGVMTGTDKTKLDGIATGAEVNVQANWIQSDSSDDSFIQNKPTIPSTIGTLSDVTISSVAQGQVLIANSAGTFVNSTLTAGSNVTITEGSGSITIAATGYTDSDARSAISVTDSGGDGSLGYNSSTGVITYTGPSASEVRAHFTGGTGIGITSGDIAVDTNTTIVAADSGDDVNITVTGPSGVADTITLEAGSNITLTESGDNTVNIALTPSVFVDDINDLTDVTITSATANDYLVYSGSAWVDQPLDVSHDSTPQLGGNLDVNTNKIVSTSNGDIDIEPHGTGNVLLGNFTFDADQSVGSGQDNYVLTYDNSAGTISLEAASGGVDTSGTPADNQLAVFTDSDTIEGDSNLTWDGTKLSADALDLEYSTTLAAAGNYAQGSKVSYNFGTTSSVTRGDVHYFNGGWVQSDADAASSASGLLAVAVGTSSTSGMVLSGVVRVHDSTGFSSASEGDVLYLDTDAGHVTVTAPSATGDVVRVVGYVINVTNKIIYFDPSSDWIELS